MRSDFGAGISVRWLDWKLDRAFLARATDRADRFDGISSPAAGCHFDNRKSGVRGGREPWGVAMVTSAIVCKLAVPSSGCR